MKMSSRRKAQYGVVLLGFALVLCIVLPLVMPATPTTILFSTILSMVLFIVGAILLLTSVRIRGPIAEILGGLALAGIGAYSTRTLIEGEVSGIYVVGFIPIPLIVVTVIAAVVGIWLFVHGTAAALKLLPRD